MYTNNTKIYGILGFPLSHTLSPWIHNTLFQLANYDGVYLVFERQDWPAVGLGSLQMMGVWGLSVTIPFKEWAFQTADEACTASKTMKASNTLLFEEGKVLAKNTDGEGALKSILVQDKSLLRSDDSSQILILGSGGSAKGILFSIAEYLKNQNKPIHKKIRILARNTTAVQEMIESLDAGNMIQPITLDAAYEESKNISLVIHTTPVGMKGIGGDALLGKDFFHKDTTLFDIVYNPLETPLVKLAKKKRSQIIPGYSMLLYQGIRQFEYFTKIEPKQKWIKAIDTLLLNKLT
ncbi:shikimate dehydrogenase [Leptospira ognonensis]|uniref:Shikimate dehydrogenase (NADP(+)) n=1 Tax=Leptospira ognonensis TaxID=2484945 RepID=A0A4R9JVT5_9LEPT|nr:shikimate dehydrogenase [Leptospira ognonensis]TGL57094.1 shikimate dehydrogenase [Leptospira ognonensis]